MENQITGHTQLAGLYAKPARHSISPLMHTTAFRETGIDAVYLSFDVEPEDLGNSMAAVKTLGMMGVNLSMPHKMAVIEFLDELSPAAELIGAVNTVVNDKGRLIGHNTDGVGFMQALKDIAVEPVGQEMTVIGAGGAATAIISQAALDGVKQINVFNRKDEFYEKIAAKLADIAAKTGCQINLQDLANESALTTALQESMLLVNATGVGMKPNDDLMPIPSAELLTENLAVFDAIYNPRHTRLLQEAAAKGLKTSNGLGMLIHQGAEAFRLWTGQEMPVAVIRPLVEKA